MTHVNGRVATGASPSRSERSSTAVFPNASTKKVPRHSNAAGRRTFVILSALRGE
jgi:hypothetical protein